jgi:hypothetical protein
MLDGLLAAQHGGQEAGDGALVTEQLVEAAAGQAATRQQGVDLGHSDGHTCDGRSAADAGDALHLGAQVGQGRELVHESPPREWEGFMFYYYPLCSQYVLFPRIIAYLVC